MKWVVYDLEEIEGYVPRVAENDRARHRITWDMSVFEQSFEIIQLLLCFMVSEKM